MKDYKNKKQPTEITKDDIFGAVMFVLCVFGGWLLINLWRG